MWLQLYFNATDPLSELWQRAWIVPAFWNVLSYVLLGVICILWAPSQNPTRYAFFISDELYLDTIFLTNFIWILLSSNDVNYLFVTWSSEHSQKNKSSEEIKVLINMDGCTCWSRHFLLLEKNISTIAPLILLSLPFNVTDYASSLEILLFSYSPIERVWKLG